MRAGRGGQLASRNRVAGEALRVIDGCSGRIRRRSMRVMTRKTPHAAIRGTIAAAEQHGEVMLEKVFGSPGTVGRDFEYSDGFAQRLTWPEIRTRSPRLKRARVARLMAVHADVAREPQ